VTVELAKAIFFIIWGGGLVVWVLGLRHSLAFLRPQDAFEGVWDGPGAEPADPGLVRGVAEVEARPQALRKELARRLPSGLGSTFLLRPGRDGLELENTLPPAVFSRFGWGNVSRVVIEVHPASMGRSQVAYALDLRPLRRRLGRVALAVVLAAGLPTLALVGGLIWWLVIPSTVPAVRWQVLQTLQIGHALWPPFLVTSRLRANVREAQVSLHAIIDAAAGTESPHE